MTMPLPTHQQMLDAQAQFGPFDDIIMEQSARIAELEARLSAVIAGSILPADAADEITVDGVTWVRVPAECTVQFIRNTEE